MDPHKVQTIVDWATPIFIWDIKCFIGFTNFYWSFIAQYYSIVAPFTHLIQKDQHFSWEVGSWYIAFQSLKVSFMTTPFLSHVNPFKPFVLKTDDSNFVVSIVFSQLGEDNLLHLVNFRSCKFFLAKINYKVHDKKLLAIVNAFEEWHHLFESVQDEIIVYSNHKNWQYFMTTHV